MGWKDGMPLTLQVMTAKKNEKEVADSALSRTDISDKKDVLAHINRWEGKTIYNVMTDRFFDGDKSNNINTDRNNPEGFHGGDWQGIVDKLDYLKDMGVEVLWISCPYENQKGFFGKDGYHGYWPVDFLSVEKNFGSVKKLGEVVEKAHQKGIKVIMDVVINHTGYNHPFTADTNYNDWFHHEGKLGVLAAFPYHAEHQSLDGLPDLRQENREVSDYLIKVHEWWAQQTGIDGFRVDAVRHVPIDFLREFNEKLCESDRHFFTLGECFWKSSNYVSRYQRRGIESSFDFPVGLKLRGVFANSNRFPGFLQKIKKLCFGNKKEMKEIITNKRITMKSLLKQFDQDDYYDNPKKLGTLVDNHDMDRFMTLAGGNKNQLKSALAFIYAIRGMPTLYYGTEAGMEGPEGSENRQDMEFGKNPDILEALKKLSAARKESMSLQYGGQRALYIDNECCAIARMRPDEEVICIFNNSGEERNLKLELKDSRIENGGTLNDMLTDYSVSRENDSITVKVPPGSYRFMQWKRK
jgi:alpha-amylase